MVLRVLSAGAAKGLVSDVRAKFVAQTGEEIEAFFGAVGTVKENFLENSDCDILILTAPLIEQFMTQDLLIAKSHAPLGTVHTGIAVPSKTPVPNISSSEMLRTSLLLSKAIYMPDGERSTAGIHFMKVLRALGIAEDVNEYLKSFSTGEEAMRLLSSASEENAIGCTQITEIIFTQGVKLVGALPKEYDLSTVYTAAVNRRSTRRDAANQLMELLSGTESRSLRARSGFEGDL